MKAGCSSLAILQEAGIARIPETEVGKSRDKLREHGDGCCTVVPSEGSWQPLHC